MIHFHVITLGNYLFIPTQAASISTSNYKEIRQRLSFILSITCSGQKGTSGVKLKRYTRKKRRVSTTETKRNHSENSGTLYLASNLRKQRLGSNASSGNSQTKYHCYKAGYELTENI